LETRAIKSPEHVLEEEGGTDSRDERDQPGGISQRAVGNALQEIGDQVEVAMDTRK
jgi:hypothetical protein